MRWTTFEDTENKGSDPYKLDFKTNEHRKYKTPMGGVRVYECGIIRVTGNGHNNPHWRMEIAGALDLRFVRPVDMVGFKFYDPDTGKRVSRKMIPTHPVYHDKARGRIYSVSHRGMLEFMSEHAQPSAENFTYRVVNEDKLRARLAELEPFMVMGQALSALEGHGEYSNSWLMWDLQELLDSGKVPQGTVADVEFKRTVVSLAQCRKGVDKLVRIATKDVFNPKFLIAKEA